jgi:hypothetical protein
MMVFELLLYKNVCMYVCMKRGLMVVFELLLYKNVCMYVCMYVEETDGGLSPS